MTAEGRSRTGGAERQDLPPAPEALAAGRERENAGTQEALQRNESRYRLLYNHTPVMMHSIDAEGVIVEVNDTWLRVMEYERDEVLGRKSVDFLSEDSRRYALEVAIPRMRETGSVSDQEIQFVKKNGEVMETLVSAVAEYDSDGRLDHTAAFILDVTEKKRQQEALRRSEARFRGLVEYAADAFFLIDSEARVLDVNQRACESLGYSRDELVGKPVPDFADATAEDIRDRLAQLDPGAVVTRQTVFHRKDGSSFPVEIRVGVFREADRMLAVSLARDISDRVRAEAAIRESEQRLAAILRSAMDAIVIIDESCRVSLFNEAAEKTFRCTADEVIGKPFDRFLSPTFSDVLPSCLVEDPEATENKQRYLWIPDGLTAHRADGTEFPVEATISQVQVGEQMLCAIILRDIDERKRAEEELRKAQRERIYLLEELSSLQSFEEIIGSSAAMKSVFEHIESVAGTDSTVLITGETGTGKELVARAIHRSSKRSDKVLVRVNCAALPSGLIESELFGHEKGAFTSAHARKIGRFELAAGGTIFLDEIGDLPLELQTKLLRVLQEGEFERLGGSKTIEADVRVIAATNRDLKTAVEEERFRADLFYRLNVFPIHLPALRERREDIPSIVRHFVMKHATKLGKRIDAIPRPSLEKLRSYDWPGNVRELENVIERAVILTQGAELELGQWLPAPENAPRRARIATLEELQREHILSVLELTGWRVRGERGAAELLDLKPTTLEARMKKLGIERAERHSEI